MTALASDVFLFLITVSHVYGSTNQGQFVGAANAKMSSYQAEYTPSSWPDKAKQFVNNILPLAEALPRPSDEVHVSLRGNSSDAEVPVTVPKATKLLKESMNEADMAVDTLKGLEKYFGSSEEITDTIIAVKASKHSVSEISNPKKDSTIHISKLGVDADFATEPTRHFRRGRDTSVLSQDVPAVNQQVTFYNFSHLMEQCPYANICNNDRKDVPKDKASCCLPCSCDSTCSSIGNCCNRQENKNLMCHSPSLSDSIANEPVGLGYFMVDKCLDGSERNCKAMTVAPWGSLYPVYDPEKDRIYLNANCAECNGVKIYTHWEIDVGCYRKEISNGHFLSALRGDKSNFCKTRFFPPKVMGSENHVCSETMISRCNITGKWKVHNAEIEQACTLWYAPVVDRFGLIKYANIYCLLCNGKEYHPDNLCSEVNPVKLTDPYAITFTINYRRAMDLVDKDASYNVESIRSGDCASDMVKHPAKLECRPILCPDGFVNVARRCQFITTTLLTNNYYIQLQLTPLTDQLLPLSYIEGLSDDQKRNPKAWLDTNGTQLDLFEVAYKKMKVENETFVKDFVVRVGRATGKLRVDREFKAIRDAISRPWTVRLNGEIFKFSVNFYRYQFHIQWSWNTRYDVEDKVKGVVTLEENTGEEPYQTVMSDTPKESSFMFKKTNFCSRVRLARSEWISGFQEIRLNISQENLDSGNMLGDSEFDIYLDDLGEPTVDICVDDFNPNYTEQPARSKSKASSQGRVHSTPIIMLVVISYMHVLLFIDIIEPPREKTNNVVSEQVRHKPTCTSTEKS